MGSIATTTAIDTLMPDITFDSATTAIASKCIDWAETKVKGKLSRRYDVSASPFTVSTSTSMLTALVEQFSLGDLYRKISRGSKESISRGEALLKDALATLEQLSDGKCDLLNSAGTDVVQGKSGYSEIISSTTGYHTTFDEDDPLNWKIDPDKLSDIKSGRL